MSYIQVEQTDKIMTITMSRFQQKNALSLDMYSELVTALTKYEESAELQVCLILGNEECFCAGNDLKDFLNSGQLNEAHPTVQFINRIATCQKPVVAAVAGPAVGIGTTMLLHFDYVIAAENAVFQLPFAQLGLCPEAASSYILPNIVGQRIAFELLVMGERFDADRARDFGIVNIVCQPKELKGIALSKTKEIAKLPHEAVIKSKRLIRQNDSETVKAMIELELTYFQQLLDSEECQTRVGKFFK